MTATVESERRLLEEFHRSAAEKEGEAQAGMIRNGYLPETPEVLVEAGVRCIPLIESEVPAISDAGSDRLKAVMFKLKMVQSGPESRRALEQFEQMIEKNEKKSDRETLYGLLMIGGLILFLTVVVFLLVRMFIK